MINPLISQAINTSTYVAVRLPPNKSCIGFGVQTADNSAYLIAYESDGSDGVQFNTPFSLPQAHGASADGTILFYAKGTTATKIVGLFI